MHCLYWHGFPDSLKMAAHFITPSNTHTLPHPMLVPSLFTPHHQDMFAISYSPFQLLLIARKNALKTISQHSNESNFILPVSFLDITIISHLVKNKQEISQCFSLLSHVTVLHLTLEKVKISSLHLQHSLSVCSQVQTIFLSFSKYKYQLEWCKTIDWQAFHCNPSLRLPHKSPLKPSIGGLGLRSPYYSQVSFVNLAGR